MSVAVEVQEFIVGEIAPDVGLLDDDFDLLGAAVIDSLGILQLISFIEEKYGVKVGDDDLDPENFRSVGRIVTFVEQKRG